MSAKTTSVPWWRRRRRGVPQRSIHHVQTPEEATIDAARGGDLRAWERITRQHQQVVFRTAYLATRDSATAETASISTFMRANRSLRSLERGAALRPWLMGIAATVARSHVRELAQRRDAKLADPDPCPRLQATPIDLEPGVPKPTPLERDVMFDAFDGLISEDRLIIASRYHFGLSRADAATLLSIQPDQIEARLASAISRLRARLTEVIAATVASGSVGRPSARPDLPVDHLLSLHDDQLGSMTMAAVMSELPWTPDVAPVACSRLAREAAAYPEQFAVHAAAGGDVVGTGAATQPAHTSTAQGRQGPAKRSGSVLSMRVAALAGVVALLGVSVGVAGLQWDGTAEVGAQVSALLGRDESRPAGGNEGEASPAGASSTAGVLLTTSQSAAAAVATSDTVPAPEASIIDAYMFEDGRVGARVSVDWPSAGPADAAVETRLERRIGNGNWRWVDSANGLGSMESAIGPGKPYRFRVRTIDEAGTAVVSPAVWVELTVRDPRSKRLALAPGDWTIRRANSIKRRLVATAPDSSLSTEFSGSSVAVVGPTGPSRGAIAARVDTGPWRQDDLRLRAQRPRVVVFNQDVEQGRHSLDIRAEADGVAVNAVLILRTLQA